MTALQNIWSFTLKFLNAGIFGLIMVFFIILTSYWYPDIGLHRLDFLFIVAIVTQIILVATKMEEPKEVVVILAFHFVATCMELFKTSGSVGSWTYPGVDEAVIKLYTVPLFAGFNYGAVGSFIARLWRIFDLRFTRYPPLWVTFILAVAIYTNFISQHFIYDIRYILMALVLVFFGLTKMHFKVNGKYYAAPVLVVQFFAAFLIWIGENVGTYTSAWLYPNQMNGWELVETSKIGSWFLLWVVSFVLVTVAHRPRPLEP